jgi:hypothetical protein
MSATDLEPEDSPRPHRQKWEAELEEILAASDREPTAVDKARGKVASARYRAPAEARGIAGRLRVRGSTGLWIAIFLALVAGAFVVSHYAPAIGRVFAIAAVAMLVIVVVRGMLRPTGDGGMSKTWRGREIDPNPSEQSWRDRLFDRDRDDDPPVQNR